MHKARSTRKQRYKRRVRRGERRRGELVKRAALLELGRRAR